MGNNITIADVANHLGISKTTVSHALSGKRRISSDLRRQVLETVEKLGYRPNFAARVMNTRRTGLVGVLVDQFLSNPYSTTLQEELGNELSHYSMQMVLGSVKQLGQGRALLARFSDGMVDGILNTLPELDNDEAVKLAHGVPLVTYRRHREAPLTIDFAAGTGKAIDYLQSLGHRKIAIIPIASRGNIGMEDPCLTCYRKLLGETGLIFHVADVSMQAGFKVAETVFSSEATAILAGNDTIAAGLFQWAAAHKLSLPERMSVVGHDDSPLASMTSPPLTSIQLPIGPIAAHTVKVLMHAIDPGEPLPDALNIVPELVIRNSCAELCH